MRRAAPRAYRTTIHALLGVATLLLVAGEAAAATLSRDAAHHDTVIPVHAWRHRTPPAIGTLLAPRRGLFLCESVAGARYSAETGFLALDCRALEHAGTWRVVACHEDTVSHGALRLIEVLAVDGRRGWVPLPWHDWA